MVDASHRFFTQAYQTLAYAARDYASGAPSVLCALRLLGRSGRCVGSRARGFLKRLLLLAGRAPSL